ncbi:MAG TPA: hypothetical protein VFV10_20455 [Gammaproteobacteria bacterium]|nr:hypothetical protein [Gammaproteobacteria bacterium]
MANAITAPAAAPGFESTEAILRLDGVRLGYAIGSIKSRPASWKDLFFAEIHAAPGS